MHRIVDSVKVNANADYFINTNKANVSAETREQFEKLLRNKHSVGSDNVYDLVAVFLYEDNAGNCIAYYDEELELGYIS